MNNTKIYWLIFSDADYFGKSFLKKGFRHVAVLTHDDYNWIKFNPKNNQMFFKILPNEISDNVPYIMLKNDSSLNILKVEVEISNRLFPSLNYFSMMNCVGIAKYFLGIWRFIFTPYSLYRYLTNIMGGYDYSNQIVHVTNVGGCHGRIK